MLYTIYRSFNQIYFIIWNLQIVKVKCNIENIKVYLSVTNCFCCRIGVWMKTCIKKPLSLRQNPIPSCSWWEPRFIAIKYSCTIDRELGMYCYNSKYKQVCAVPMHTHGEECSRKCMGFIYKLSVSSSGLYLTAYLHTDNQLIYRGQVCG